MKKLCAIFILMASVSARAQVGIGTTSPQEMLHVEGDLIVTGYNNLDNSTSLVGADTVGNLTTLNIDNRLMVVNNQISTVNSIYYEIGRQDLSALTTSGGNQVHDLDLKLALGEANHGKTIVKVYNLPGNIKITGIQDGVDGQHLFFYHSGTATIVFLDELDNAASSSQAQNRIKVLAGSETITGRGSVEMFYDGTVQRWVILSIHD